ncbi:glycoside hydrolase [Paraphoma chrysanthemicola]|uniref:AA9 family lytic polysaccharide monooxygenase n=1 Tax=Paraphoma chrysanthemicola TaxID=798071 RepID=A0A8K0QZ77_9PLEO|nr:glycoside hydrolase [Paraphoma chrysanthemicola]
MKLNFLSIVALATTVSAHSIAQRISVNGQVQPLYSGVRVPSSNYPIQNVNDGDFACNKAIGHKDNNIITVPAGARVGALWGHVRGGAQYANDPDHPIAKSHKGPISYWLAKVDNAASTGTTGLQWFKVAHEGLANGKWAVDTMIEGGGWHYFTLPTCIAPGDYLLRVELLALHSASKQGEAQFYMSCAQIRVTGSGSNRGSNYVSFPGAYSANDPGILVGIYINGRPYPTSYSIPGPAPLRC